MALATSDEKFAILDHGSSSWLEARSSEQPSLKAAGVGRTTPSHASRRRTYDLTLSGAVRRPELIILQFRPQHCLYFRPDPHEQGSFRPGRCAALSAPTEGRVTFEGKPVAGTVPDGVGAVFQEDASFPWLTVSDNVAFGLRRAGMDGAEIRRRVDYALGFMGLRDFARAYPAQLSGGMRQRVCIARTLVLQPRLILLDEPFGALDAQTRLLMGDELLKLWRETGATVLLITHALDEAAMLSDRIGAMSARPGRFLETVETGWPRDRDSGMLEGETFGHITGRLWQMLRAESKRAMGYETATGGTA